MKCPSCGCEHPAHYERCLACNAPLYARAQSFEQESMSPIRMRRGLGASNPDSSNVPEDDDANDIPMPGSYRPPRRSLKRARNNLPKLLGVVIAAVVLTGSVAGTTVFFLKSPDDRRLQERGEKELANAQYAFAVETLTKASKSRPDDARILLELARAYVGIDQVNKAWDCVNQAQKLGAGVIAEPALSSDLANYYRRRGKYDRAAALLRPLAKADVAGKKAELADLDAAWGDDLLVRGFLEEALHCWEEVSTLGDGSRYTEAQARLVTIYQKLANHLASNNDDEPALAYLTKLNNIAQNARNYELAADIYEREGKLDLAVEQLRKANNMSSQNSALAGRLANLLTRRGKELLDAGDVNTGYGYLQQAKELNPQNSVPGATLRSVAAGVDTATRQPKITGDVWNPTDKAISSLILKVELWNNENSKTLWEKEERIVDQFTTPLGSHESKHFEYSVPVVVDMDGKTEIRTYIDGGLYKAYPLGSLAERTANDSAKRKSELKAKADQVESSKPAAKGPPDAEEKYTHPAASAPVVVPAPAFAPYTEPSSRGSSEEKTMKDLDM